MAEPAIFCAHWVLFVVFLKDGPIVWLMGFEQMEDDSREFMRNRRDCREAANREKDWKILFYLKMLNSNGSVWVYTAVIHHARMEILA